MSFEDREIGAIDLIDLVDPENRRADLPGRDCVPMASQPKDEAERQLRYARQLSCAFDAFHTYHLSYAEFTAAVDSNDRRAEAAIDSVALSVRRNRIQDRIMVRSDALCADFQRRLGIELRLENDSTFGTFLRNSQTRLVGGVGSLFLNSDALWALTNAARITGLPGYVPDGDQLEVKVGEVALAGINWRRRAVRDEINAKRFVRYAPGEDPFGQPLVPEDVRRNDPDRIQPYTGIVSIASYSLEEAVGDVIAYHNSCSINIGLGTVADIVGDLNDGTLKFAPTVD